MVYVSFPFTSQVKPPPPEQITVIYEWEKGANSGRYNTVADTSPITFLEDFLLTHTRAIKTWTIPLYDHSSMQIYESSKEN